MQEVRPIRLVEVMRSTFGSMVVMRTIFRPVEVMRQTELRKSSVVIRKGGCLLFYFFTDLIVYSFGYILFLECNCNKLYSIQPIASASTVYSLRN